jgi:hypothetical protein
MIFTGTVVPGSVCAALLRRGKLIEQLITHRHRPDEFSSVFLQHPSDEIKAVIEWNGTVHETQRH